LGAVAIGIGMAQVGVSVLQHKSTEAGKDIKEEAGGGK